MTVGEIGQLIALSELAARVRESPKAVGLPDDHLASPGVVIGVWINGRWIAGYFVPVRGPSLFTVLRSAASILAGILADMVDECKQVAQEGEFIPFPTGQD